MTYILSWVLTILLETSVSLPLPPVAINAKMVTDHIGKSSPNLINPSEIPGRRIKIGGAIRAKTLGEANDDGEFIPESHDSAIPIFKGIVIGVNGIRL